MELSYLIGLLGGLVLFLYGMNLMSQGLELAAGNKMQKIIERFTSNRLSGVLIGTIVTAVIQSSSATTVMVVGFVNANLMTLGQAVGVIMGANIGTTVTGQLVALDIVKIAPLFAFAGFIMANFVKGKQRVKFIGTALLGLGILFMGMNIMSDSMKPLRESQVFIDLITKLHNPILGILAGVTITGIIQSSSASIGILQIIANQGLITVAGSMYIVCGFNIGTCVTSLLSSIGTSKNAKRTATVHILFNVIGTLIFLILTLILPITQNVDKIMGASAAAKIANMHTFFNVGSTILLFPFANSLVKLSSKIITGEDKFRESKALKYINLAHKKSPIALFTDVRAETLRMLGLTEKNLDLVMNDFYKIDDETREELYDNEEVINYLNDAISSTIIENLPLAKDPDLSEKYTDYLRISRDLERMGDHIKNFYEEYYLIVKEDGRFSIECTQEMDKIHTALHQIYETIQGNETQADKIYFIQKAYKDNIRLNESIRSAHLERMKSGACMLNASVSYEKMLIALERINSYLTKAGKLLVQ